MSQHPNRAPVPATAVEMRHTSELADWTAQQAAYRDSAYEAGDLERAHRLQMALVVALALNSLEAEGAPVPDWPRARLETLPLERHREAVHSTEAHLSSENPVSDLARVAFEALSAALDARQRIAAMKQRPPTETYALLLAMAALGEASARLAAQREGYFPAAAAHQRSVRQGSRNLEARRDEQRWWWPVAEDMWRELDPALSVKQRENLIVERLGAMAGTRAVPKHSAVKRVRRKDWRA